MSREIRHKGNPPSRKATAGKQAQRHKAKDRDSGLGAREK